jgi:hypothetical protein
MKSLSDYIALHIDEAADAFEREISTDENKDYRRGFRAGVLFSYLHIKSNIGSLDTTAIELKNFSE